jgi:hypothetical protein
MLVLQQVDKFSRQVHKLERGQAPNDLVPKLREEVNRWQVCWTPALRLSYQCDTVHMWTHLVWVAVRLNGKCL